MWSKLGVLAIGANIKYGLADLSNERIQHDQLLYLFN
jgi:hypothetical protein